MKSLTRLEAVVFQLTPTRTRCDLVISANGKTEKLASGLLNPFLAHLKAAEDQMAKGGYSITLQPESGTNASWFTKETVERFVRFVSTPEILERVHTLELEILEIEEAIAIQSNNNTGLSVIEDHQSKLSGSKGGNKVMPDTSEEKAIVLYTPGAHPAEANKTAVQEENSKVQLLKVLETRKTVLQKEQGMAFARAEAAGFDIDNMSPLKCFARMFGAARLMDACSKFMELWKRKHETGEWLEIEPEEVISVRLDFSNMNASGIVLVNKQKELKEPWSERSENNGKGSMDMSTDEKPSPNQQTPAPQGYFQGQFPHPMYPPRPMHSPPGAVPGFQGYPVQGMPYYQNYPGNGSYFLQPYPSVEDPRHNAGRMGSRRHSLDGSNSHNGSVTWEMEKARSSQDDLELENEHGQSEEGNRRSRSGKRSSGRVVIRNINYITSNRQHASGSDSESSSNSGTGEEDQDLSLNSPKRKHKSCHRFSEKKGRQGKLLDVSDKEGVNGREVDGGQWQAFQSFLLRDAEEEETEANRDMFSMEKEVRMKRKTNMVSEDPLASDARRKGQFEAGALSDMHRMSANMTRLPKASHDESLIPGRVGHSGNRRSFMDGEIDVQSSDVNGTRLYRRALNDGFMVDGRESQNGIPTSPSDPMAVSGSERISNSLDRRSSSHSMNDESCIVLFRSISIAEDGHDGRNAMDIDSEIPPLHQNGKYVANSRVNYEPDGLTLMPERGNGHGSSAYDPALDYEMRAHTEDKKNKETVIDSKQASKKLDKDQKLKGILNSSDRKKVGGPIRKGKTSKASPLEDAKARAEKLRTFKADLQKMKKEQDEAERRRLEALKIERQKRIATRGGSNPAQSPIPNLQTRKQLPTKASPSSQKGSKFSDSEPGLSSPLQRSKVAILSIGSADSQKKSKPSKLNGSQSSGHRLTRSVSSLPEQKKEDGDATLDKKASMARIRRLSEPKMSSSPHVSSVKAKSSEAASKAKTRSVPDSKKITAIVNHDKSKIASLPELKIKAPEVTRKRSVENKMVQKEGNGEVMSMTVTEPIKNKDRASSHGDVGDCTVVEKNVLILENQKPSVPPLSLQEGANGLQKQQFSAHEIDNETAIATNYAAIHVPVSPMDIDQPDTQQNKQTAQQKPHIYKVDTANLNNTRNDLPNLSRSGVDEKPYQAPYARISSLEDPCTRKSEHGKAPPTSMQAAAKNTETVKAHVSDVRSLKLEKIPEAAAKLQIKESSKGLRKLLKFGKKNHSSTASDSNIGPDNASVDGLEVDESVRNTASSAEASRHFSLFSTFRNKSGGEKKPTAL